MKNCVFSCHFRYDKSKNAYQKIHFQNLKRYCKKYNLQHFILTQPIEKYSSLDSQGCPSYYRNIYHRFFMYELLDKYDRVLYVDSDMLFLQKCQNIFDLVPFDNIGYVKMMPLQKYQTLIGFYNEINSTNYITQETSGGFHLFSNIHKKYLDIKELKIDQFRKRNWNFFLDVHYIDYLISKLKNTKQFSIYQLPMEYNFLYAHPHYSSNQWRNWNRQYANSGNVKIIHFPALSPPSLQPTRYSLMLDFDNRLGVK